ncbi:pumilio family protein, partial [Haematococcus lacustris]
LLNDLKNGKGAHLQLADLTGHIAELSLDQHGSRFVQQKLETAPKELIAAVLLELVPSGISLMTDVFGNYVMQKLLEFGTYEHHQLMAGMMRGQVLALSMQMYGCRVVQRALEVFDPDMQCALVAELDGAVMKCVRDQSGNHVIQKVIECVPTSRILPLLDNFLPCVIPLATHPFGCRIIQRLLEFCSDKHRKDTILREVLSEVVQLAQDTYGNYVIQHVLERGSPEERSQASGPSIVHSLVPCVVPLSMHKFASNVIEKSLAHSSDSDRCLLVNALSDESGPLGPLDRLMRDQFGSDDQGSCTSTRMLLEVCNDEQRDVLLERVRDQLQTLKRFTYGKHIVARMEKLLSTGV